MTATGFAPPAIEPVELSNALRTQGYAVLAPSGVAQWLGLPLQSLDAMRADWDDLPPDAYLKDGGRYRQRRHACFTVEGEAVVAAPHRAHWQPVEYNALHGGMRRWFEPMRADTLEQDGWQRLMQRIAQAASDLYGARRWFVEAHQFRIDTAGGIGRPTPEGAHRDGVDLVAVMLVARQGVRGGETRVFEAEGRRGERFTLTEPWTLLLLDDSRVIHESTPIQPLAALRGPADEAGGETGGAGASDEPARGWRDTLVVTCRRDAFQGDDEPGSTPQA